MGSEAVVTEARCWKPLEWGREKLWLFLGHRSSLREDRGSLPQDPQPEVPVLRG